MPNLRSPICPRIFRVSLALGGEILRETGSRKRQELVASAANAPACEALLPRRLTGLRLPPRELILELAFGSGHGLRHLQAIPLKQELNSFDLRASL